MGVNGFRKCHQSPCSQLEDSMKTALRFLLSVPCLAILLTGVTAAHADTLTFYFTDTLVGGGSGSGIITAVADATIPNAFDVTSISGTIGDPASDGFTITGLLPCAANSPSAPCSSSGNSFLYDNLLYTQQLLPVDLNGIGFALGNSELEGTIAAASTHTMNLVLNSEHGGVLPVDFTVALSPEPGSFVLFGTGLLGVAGVVRRRLNS
jgi:PEP-CTERM motif